jgi:hypothetical protein
MADNVLGVFLVVLLLLFSFFQTMCYGPVCGCSSLKASFS